MRRKDGKVIQLYSIYVNREKIVIPLRLVTLGHSRGNVCDFTYVVNMEEPSFRVTHKDPNECLQLAKAEVERLLALKWTPMLLVSVETEREDIGYGNRGDDRVATGRLKIDVRAMEITERDGVKLYRAAGSTHTNEGSPANEEEGDSLIPDTPVNRERVDVIVRGLQLLASRVHELLGQKQIVKTLANLNLLALPAPKPERPRAKRKP